MRTYPVPSNPYLELCCFSRGRWPFSGPYNLTYWRMNKTALAWIPFVGLSFYKNIAFIAIAQALDKQFKVSIVLQREKWNLRFIAISLQIFWQKFYRNICWVVLHQAYHFSPNLSIWLVVMATERLNLRKKNKNQVPRIVHNTCISLYKNIVFFYCRCLRTLVTMATLNFHKLIMGKRKISI